MTASDILLLIISLSLAGSLLYGAVSIIRLLLKDRIKMRWIYLMLKIAMLFYLLPSFFIAAFAWKHFLAVSYLNVNGADLSQILVRGKINSFANSFGQNLGNSFFFILFLCIWAGGFILCYLVALIQDLLLLRDLKSVSQICVDSDICNLSKIISKRYKIRTPVSIYQTEIFTSPFIVGIFKPIIFLPKKVFEPEILELILSHELWHYKSHDVLYKSLVTFISGIHWFNPVIYLFSKSFSNCGELSCDEIVLEGCRKEKRIQYAEVIVQMINTNKQNFITVDMSEGQMNFLKRRLYYIMREKTHSKKSAILLMIAIFIFACPISVFAAVSTTAYAQDFIVDQLHISQSEVVAQTPIEAFTEYSQTINSDAINTTFSITPRGANPIDVTLYGTTISNFNTITLPQGATVKFVIGADNSSDSFKCGITKGIKSRYVNSSNGTVNYTFKITDSGDYTLFLQGATSGNIHVTGMITITE